MTKNMIEYEVAFLAADVPYMVRASLLINCEPHLTKDPASGTEMIDRAVFADMLDKTLDEMPGARAVWLQRKSETDYWKQQQARIDAARAVLRRRLGIKEPK